MLRRWPFDHRSGVTVVAEHGDLTADAEIVRPDLPPGLVGLVAKRVEDLDDLAQRMKARAELGTASRRLARG